MYKGYLCLVLHAHLPFVRHPEEDEFLEENWLYEAVTETYIPLIAVFDRLIQDLVDFRVTMTLSPTLVSMLQDELLQTRYIRHINRLADLADKEAERTRGDTHFHELALMYRRSIREARDIFVNRCGRDIVSAFRRFQDAGYMEIITCAATHAFLPAMEPNEADVRAQVLIAAEHYRKTFGRPPAGIWLPECGYYPGLDRILNEAGIKYFFLDSHGIMNADPQPVYGVFAPVCCPSGVAAFARDVESSKQVWSSKEGYPGDPDYREYYRDIGYDLEYNYIRPYIHKDGFRINTGIKYYRITGETGHKEPYRPERAREKAAAHADNFMFNREKQIEHLAAGMDRRPVIVSPYDAELFGHWWFEGPQWIDLLLRKAAYDQNVFRTVTPSEYLKEYPVNQMCLPSASSWGYRGYGEVWIEGSNDWLYRHLHHAGGRMRELALRAAAAGEGADRRTKAALDQAARELLLAQASDWPFIMKTGTMVGYAHKRAKSHLNRFTRLYGDIMNGKVDGEWLGEVESRDNIFAGMDCARFYTGNFADSR